MKHKQPLELAQLKGATRHDPQRYRREPIKNSFDVGNPPDHMGETAKTIWFELQTYALPGVLTASERFLLEILSNYLVEYRLDPTEFPAAKMHQLIGGLARLGLSPADRQKLGVEKPPEKNDFDVF